MHQNRTSPRWLSVFFSSSELCPSLRLWQHATLLTHSPLAYQTPDNFLFAHKVIRAVHTRREKKIASERASARFPTTFLWNERLPPHTLLPPTFSHVYPFERTHAQDQNHALLQRGFRLAFYELRVFLRTFLGLVLHHNHLPCPGLPAPSHTHTRRDPKKVLLERTFQQPSHIYIFDTSRSLHAPILLHAHTQSRNRPSDNLRESLPHTFSPALGLTPIHLSTISSLPSIHHALAPYEMRLPLKILLRSFSCASMSRGLVEPLVVSGCRATIWYCLWLSCFTALRTTNRPSLKFL
mmetsp:Transcript_21191/g.35065  ORF Transcript_21191/g.35065 Transcript_21191/m.35065 type:complete len:295 (-) Transcript_21191:672-1556(-)